MIIMVTYQINCSMYNEIDIVVWIGLSITNYFLGSPFHGFYSGYSPLEGFIHFYVYLNETCIFCINVEYVYLWGTMLHGVQCISHLFGDIQTFS